MKRNLYSIGATWVKSYKTAATIMGHVLVIIICIEIGTAFVVKIRERLARSASTRGAQVFCGSSYYSSKNWGGQYCNEATQSDREEYYPYVIWRRLPYKGTYINVGDSGIRKTPGAECGPNSYKVFAFGGSTMWGGGSPDWNTIPAFLQVGFQKLRDEKVCVINFGVSGFVSTQAVIQLLMRLQSGDVPNLVIFYDGINEVYTGYESGKAGVHEKLDRIAAKLAGMNLPEARVKTETSHWAELSYSGSLLKLLVTKFSQQAQTNTKPPTYESMGIAAAALANSIAQTYLGNYRIVAALGEKYHFKHFFFWEPVIFVGEKRLTREEEEIKRGWDSASKELYTRTYSVIEHAAYNYESLHYLANFFDGEDRLVWTEFNRVTQEANELIANEMLRVMTVQRNKPRRGTSPLPWQTFRKTSG